MRAKLKIILTILITSWFLISCATTRSIQYIEVPKVKTEYVSKIDTLFIKDSVFVDRYKVADTVFIVKDKYKYITKIKCDSIIKADTITVIKEVEVPTPFVPDYYKKINKGFWILLSILLLFVGWRVFKFAKVFI